MPSKHYITIVRPSSRKETARAIHRNQRAYNSLSSDYESLHGEIFNPSEQKRLRLALNEAITSIKTTTKPKFALDFGCGSGNLTRHLLELGLSVTAADVSHAFLKMVSETFSESGKLNVLPINGIDLAKIADATFDITAAYSVLHHVPDYLEIVRELHRVTKPNGIIFLDHESNGVHWSNDPTYTEFLATVYASGEPVDDTISIIDRCIHKLNRIAFRVKRYFSPRYMPEGDIHVFPDDHIDWRSIRTLLESLDSEIVKEEDYLLYASWYSHAVFEEFRFRCADTRLLVARKK